MNGQFKHLDDFIYNDGTTNIPSDLPLLVVNTNYLSPGLRGAGLAMCCIVILFSLSATIWTQIHSRARVVRAAQPIFLHLLSLGILIVGCAIIPLSFDEGSTTSQDGCDIACKSFPFLLSVGFNLTFAALWAKTHRVNLIIQNPTSFRRIQVSAADVGKPIVVVVGINVLILILWMVFAPLECATEILDWDIHGRPSETRGYCSSSESSSISSLGFVVALCIFTLGPLILSVYEAYVARHISTEYAETDYILKALVLISVVCFIGIPVLIIAHDNPSAYYFVTSAILFVICISVLCLIFGPKIMAHYNWTVLGRNGGGGGGGNNNPTSSSQRRKIPKRYSHCGSTGGPSNNYASSNLTSSPGSSYTDALGLMIMNHPNNNNNRSNESLEHDNNMLREDNEKLSRSLERLLQVRNNSDMLQEVFQQIQSEHPDLSLLGGKNRNNSSMAVEAAGSITREDDSSTFNNMSAGMMDTIMESEKTSMSTFESNANNHNNNNGTAAITATTTGNVGRDANSMERTEQPIIVVVKNEEEEEEEEDKTTKTCNLNIPEST